MTSVTHRSPGRAALALLSALALALTLLPPSITSAAAVEASSDVWINEFHYDNDGTDAGEFVEVALSVGTDLTDWSIVAYNGNGGGTSGTTALGGLPAQGAVEGFAFVVASIPGLQNGSPDGFALVDASGTVVQFLSYEGSFTAVGGPADGMMSTDVGVDEPSTTPVGQSLQLAGTGSSYADFAWTGPIAETPGAANPAQTFAGAPPQVWVNEFHYDNDGADVGEFVEVVASVGTDLTDWSIVAYNGNGGGTSGTTALGGLPAQGAVEGFAFVVASIPGLQNGSPDGFALVDASGTVVQFLSYEGSFTAVGGPADGMMSTDVGVDEPSTTPVGQSLQLAGTGSSYADFAWTGPIAETPGAANSGQTLQAGPGNGDGNAPIAPACDDLTVSRGEGGSVALSASDVDGNVVTAEITDGPEGVTLLDPVPAGAVGEALTVDLIVEDTLGARDYPVVVTFTNDDDAPQTASCTVTVTVFLDVPDDVCAIDPVEVTAINEIQGDGAETPIAGEFVVTRGVVTADFTSGPTETSEVPANEGLRGFFMEAITGDRDDDAMTSEGVFVFDGGADFDGEVGDLVHVAGTAGEFGGVTQVSVSDISVCAATGVDTTLPAPAALELPTSVGDRGTVLEPTESMRVTHPELTVVEFFELERYGEIRVSSGGVLQNPTNVVAPDDDAAYEALVEFNAANNIILDDGRTGQNLDPLPYVTPGDTLRIGDQAIDETFVLHFGFGEWRLQPVDIDALTEEFRTNRTRPRPETPPEVGGSIKVGAFNVLNYFNGDGYFIGDDPATATGFPTARGARNVGEFERQTEKIVDAIVRMDADILGLIEIENDGGDDQAAAALVDAVNTEAGEGTYDYIDTGTIGTDEIKLAFIYKTSTVEPNGDYAVLDSSVDSRFDDGSNRPVLAQTFTELATGESVTVANNHLKSKGSGCGEGDDDPRQGSCNLTRTNAAAALADWLATDPTGVGATGSMIVGDLNSYAKEDPIATLQAAGYTDLLDAFAVDGVMPYTYTFDATQGYLDYALADEDLLPFVTGAAAWNINADEVVAIDYYLSTDGRFRTADVAERFYDDSAFRSSDHDPVLVGLDLAPEPENVPPTVEDLALTTDQDTPVDGQLEFADADGDSVTVLYGTPGNGAVVGDGTGAFTYTPAEGFFGTDTFTVTVDDGRGGQDTATVTITVNEEVVPPPTVPVDKDECKQGGWTSFTDPSFRNQGQCVSFVASGQSRGATDAPGNGAAGRR